MSKKITLLPNLLGRGKTALVCGCAGFIGQHLVSQLVKQGLVVTGIDLREPEWCRPHEFLRSDVLKTFRFPIRPFDYIFQFAEDVGGTAAILKGNVLRTLNTLEINSAILKRLIWADFKGIIFFPSSSAVYGGSMMTPYPACPSSEYGWAKLMCERLYMAAAKEHGLRVRVGRLNNVYGPGDHLDPARIKSMAAFCSQVLAAKRGGEIKIWGSGKQLRAYTYVEDAVIGICNAIAFWGSDFNVPRDISAAEGISIDNLVLLIARLAKKKIHRTHTDHAAGPDYRIPHGAGLRITPLDKGILRTLADIRKRLK